MFTKRDRISEEEEEEESGKSNLKMALSNESYLYTGLALWSLEIRFGPGMTHSFFILNRKFIR